MFKTITGLLSTKHSVKKVTPEFIDQLPVTTDPVHVGIMQMLDAFIFPCYTGKPELLALVCIEMNRYTFRNGVTPYAPVSFSFLGFILSHYLGDLEGGKVYAEHAFAMLKKYNYKSVEPRTLFMINSAVWHWTNPLQNVMQSFVDIYDMGMRAGDCETALVSIRYYLEAALYTGRDLESIESDLSIYMNQMVDYKQLKALRLSQALLWTVRNLQGKSSNTPNLTGSAMEEETSMKKYVEAKDELMIAHMHRRQMYLSCYFGEYALGAELAVREGDRTMKALIAQISVPVIAFVGALCCFAEAGRTKNRQYKRQAIRYRRMIKKWSQHNPNCVHYLIILDAEKVALGGNSDKATELYEKAIMFTGRSGLLPDQALANERLAELLLKQNLKEDARYKFERAIDLYREWKANHKVKQLERRVDAL
jgi:hypothetical protein